jgi:dihydroxyacetone kinase-like protein
MDRGADAGTALTEAVTAAEAGLAATAHLPAARGRARRLAARSIGHPDAGAASTVLVWRAAAGQLQAVTR